MEFNFSPELIKTLLFVSITVLIAVVGNHILCSFIRVPKSFDTRRSRTYVAILRYIVTVIVYAIALNIILLELGINITPLIASAGIAGVIVGLGARSLIEDLIAGVFLLSQDSIAIGDTVKIDDAEGKIEKIGFRTLLIRAGNGSLHIIPNGQVKKVINFSRHKAHIAVSLPVKANQPVAKVLQAAEEALEALEKDKSIAGFLFPGAKVGGISEFQPLGPMIVNVNLVVPNEEKDKVAQHYRLLAKKAFEKHRIQFG